MSLVNRWKPAARTDETQPITDWAGGKPSWGGFKGNAEETELRKARFGNYAATHTTKGLCPSLAGTHDNQLSPQRQINVASVTGSFGRV